MEGRAQPARPDLVSRIDRLAVTHHCHSSAIMTIRPLTVGCTRLQSSALVISDEACLAAGLDAFRVHAGAPPDVTVGWFGSRIATLQGDSDLAPEVTRR